MTRTTEHLFVRDHVPLDISSCRHCGMPDFYCRCDPEEEELPPYRGADPALYPNERKH